MEEQQDGTKQLQDPPPPDLGGKRKYIRKLLEAFEPHQEAMFADFAHGEHGAEQEYTLAEPHAHFSSTLQKVVAHPLPKGVPQLFANEMACQCFQRKSYDG